MKTRSIHRCFGGTVGFHSAEPWRADYRMGTHVASERPALVERHFPIDGERRGITGHSVGGHGALTLALRDPARWHSVSAIAPIAHPTDVPWGQKAFGQYFGGDRERAAAHGATLLLRAGHVHAGAILVGQGLDDQFLATQLRPEALQAAARDAGQDLLLRRHAGYDHSYWFVQSATADHLGHHAELPRA